MSCNRLRRKGSTLQSSHNNYKIILVEWEDCGQQFLNGISFASKQENIQVHIFVNQTKEGTTANQNIQNTRIALKNVAVFHESLTDGKDASWTDLLAYLINFYARTTFSCHHCASMHSKPSYQVTLAARDQGKYKELKALLKSNKTETKVVDGWKTTLLDLLAHVCTECKIIFNDQREAQLHDKEDHNYLCENESCERSRRENGFYSHKELSKHQRRQQQCEFCHGKIFCDTSKYQEHMSKYHIFCDCSCQKYYNTLEEFIQHYGGVYPLPCLEVPDCKERFRNIDEQAFHHKSSHGSKYPYYCIACYGHQKLTCLRTSGELMKHVSDVKHKKNEFQIVMIPEESPFAHMYQQNSSSEHSA